jgi:hypothetical protein
MSTWTWCILLELLAVTCDISPRRSVVNILHSKVQRYSSSARPRAPHALGLPVTMGVLCSSQRFSRWL